MRHTLHAVCIIWALSGFCRPGHADSICIVEAGAGKAVISLGSEAPQTLAEAAAELREGELAGHSSFYRFPIQSADQD